MAPPAIKLGLKAVQNMNAIDRQARSNATEGSVVGASSCWQLHTRAESKAGGNGVLLQATQNMKGRSEHVDESEHESEKEDGRQDDSEQSGAALVVCRAGQTGGGGTAA